MTMCKTFDWTYDCLSLAFGSLKLVQTVSTNRHIPKQRCSCAVLHRALNKARIWRSEVTHRCCERARHLRKRDRPLYDGLDLANRYTLGIAHDFTPRSNHLKFRPAVCANSTALRWRFHALIQLLLSLIQSLWSSERRCNTIVSS